MLKKPSDSGILALFQQLRGRAERAVPPQRRLSVLLAPVPWSGGGASSLLPSPREEAPALPGASATGHPPRVGEAEQKEPRGVQDHGQVFGGRDDVQGHHLQDA